MNITIISENTGIRVKSPDNLTSEDMQNALVSLIATFVEYGMTAEDATVSSKYGITLGIVRRMEHGNP